MENQGRRVKALLFVLLLAFTTNLMAAAAPRKPGWGDRFFNRAWKAISRFVGYGDVLSVPDGKP